MKYLCSTTDDGCGWHGTDHDLLKAPNPFEEGVLWACPQCRSLYALRMACDEPDCWEQQSCGFPTPKGYRLTCGKHYQPAQIQEKAATPSVACEGGVQEACEGLKT